MAATKKTTWERRILADALKELRHEFGEGWHVLGERIQRALLAEKLVIAISHLDHENNEDTKAYLFERVQGAAAECLLSSTLRRT